jgi:hypothetical protein
MTTIETKIRFALLAALAAAGVQRSADAAEAVSSVPSLPANVAPSDADPRYSLPWQLRPATIGNLARVDSVAAVFNDANGNLDEAVATVVTASYRIDRSWAPLVRLAFVGNDAPGQATDGRSFANPLVGATYARALGRYRLALFGAATLPIGSGGGAAPNLRAAKTNEASRTARPADAAMFAVDDLTAIAGADLAYVNEGLTAQAEATLLQHLRVRGATEPFRTEAAVGLHAGYFLGAHFSLSGDLHHRRWLSDSEGDLARTTVAVGPRLHFRVGQQGWVRPGISVVRGLDSRGVGAPLLTAQATGVQLDVPVTF